MSPVSEQLEEAIRQHERLLLSRQKIVAKLAQKQTVQAMVERSREMEIESLQASLARVEAEIAEVEAQIAELKGADHE